MCTIVFVTERHSQAEVLKGDSGSVPAQRIRYLLIILVLRGSGIVDSGLK